jgi:hypothetical protein
MVVNIAQAGGNIKNDVKGKTTDATSCLGSRLQGVQGSRGGDMYTRYILVKRLKNCP